MTARMLWTRLLEGSLWGRLLWCAHARGADASVADRPVQLPRTTQLDVSAAESIGYVLSAGLPRVYAASTDPE